MNPINFSDFYLATSSGQILKLLKYFLSTTLDQILAESALAAL